MTHQKGLYIAFAGGEGSGKSTQIKLLATHLGSLGLEVVVTKEPGGTRLGTDIRATLLDSEIKKTPEAEMLLFCADRAQLMSEVIWPALDQGVIVLSDRSYVETYAYQIRARGCENLRTLLDAITARIAKRIDLCVLLDIDPVIGLGRARTRRSASGAPTDHFEAEDFRFHTYVRAGFKQELIIRTDANAVVDASRSVEEVGENIRRVVERFLQDRGFLE